MYINYMNYTFYKMPIKLILIKYVIINTGTPLLELLTE